MGGAPKRVNAPCGGWRARITGDFREFSLWQDYLARTEPVSTSSSESESESELVSDGSATEPIGFVPSRTRSGAIYNRPSIYSYSATQ